MAKKKPGKPVTSAPVIKQTLSKSALINLIAEQNDIPRKTAVGVFNTLESVMLGSVHPRGVGEFTLPGLLKISLAQGSSAQGRHAHSQPGYRRNDEGCRQTRQCAS